MELVDSNLCYLHLQFPFHMTFYSFANKDWWLWCLSYLHDITSYNVANIKFHLPFVMVLIELTKLSTQDTRFGKMARSMQMILPHHRKNVAGEIMLGELYMHWSVEKRSLCRLKIFLWSHLNFFICLW